MISTLLANLDVESMYAKSTAESTFEISKIPVSFGSVWVLHNYQGQHQAGICQSSYLCIYVCLVLGHLSLVSKNKLSLKTFTTTKLANSKRFDSSTSDLRKLNMIDNFSQQYLSTRERAYNIFMQVYGLVVIISYS